MSVLPHAPGAAASPARIGRRVYVWDLLVRVTHWTIATAFLVLAVTGLYVGTPFIDVQSGDAYVMGTFRAVHFYASIAFTLAVLSRLLWMFISPNPNARYDQFVPIHRHRRKGFRGTLAFYFFMRPRPPVFSGHNPVAGLAYTGVFALYLLMILTGLGLYGMGAHLDSVMHWFGWLVDVFGGPQNARWIHHVVMWLLVAFVVQHVYSAVLFSIGEENAGVDGIVSGYKWIEEEEE